MSRKPPIIGITMGDPAGIGPEIILKALNYREIHEISKPVVIGSPRILREEMKTLYSSKVELTIREIESVKEAIFGYPTVNVIDPSPSLERIEKGKLQAIAGAAAVSYIVRASELAKKGEIDAIVTAPINKKAINLAGYNFSGHTELLAELFERERYAMVLACDNLFVTHVTTHIAFKDVPKRISVEGVLEKIKISHALAKALNLTSKPIAVAGLNPHAGEEGLFGDEEIRIIKPAIDLAKEMGINVSGPWPADALFPKAKRGEFNFIVVMYHDQGHIPFKTLYFDEGVNITVGLPVVRTSVDHGTAFDIAGKGIASERSMLESIRLAVRLAPFWKEINDYI